MNNTVLITGSTRGIGLGIAKKLALEGYNLVLNGIRAESEVLNIIEELRLNGSDVIYCQGDISDPAAREKILKTIEKEFGELNVLINNAGVAPLKRYDLLHTTYESFNRVMKTNLEGPFFLTQEVANYMIKQKARNIEFAGCMINITSISSVVASTNRGEYCISKAGMTMMSQLFAVRMAEYDIPVYEVRPGITKTDMTAKVQEKYDHLIREGLLLEKRWGTPDDIGRCVAALVRGDLPYASGQVITIDGGLTIHRL